MNHLMRGILISGLGGMAVYCFFVIGKYGLDDVQAKFIIQAFGFGCLAGLIIGALDEVSGRSLPLINSWLALGVCVFVVLPMLRAPLRDDLFWAAFIYGYTAHLIWQGYQGKLQKY
ncbi:hypothetical protein [Candidatus Uabimicrobium sp. HlEnr_7]|uniref:hypothetical protein n=1 Tax=Candidatus Uabimicrobium helgolandensis TaxID=3095367 RepID=UPI003555E837